MNVAITRPVPKSIARCELTHLEREPIDVTIAETQHRKYEETLRDLGCAVRSVDRADDFPDSVFVEDTAIVLNDVAIITRPGAESRRGEVDSVAAVLAGYRRLVRIEAPATIDGGDVLVVGKRIFVGLSSRSDREAVEQLRRVAAASGYRVDALEVRGCLHLKSAVTALPGGALVLNPNWVDRSLLGSADIVEIDPSEPYAANVLSIGDEVLCAAAFPRTRERLEQRGYRTRTVDASELAKAEGALTCCSILVG